MDINEKMNNAIINDDIDSIEKTVSKGYCELLGGLTTHNGIGKWLNKGKIYNDKLNIYQVAIQPSKKKLFIKLCKKYGKLTQQLAIYVVINNKARIIQL